jgi:hypothetical protein
MGCTSSALCTNAEDCPTTCIRGVGKVDDEINYVITEEDMKTQVDVDLVVDSSILGDVEIIEKEGQESKHDMYVRGHHASNDFVFLPPTEVTAPRSDSNKTFDAVNAHVCIVNEEKHEDRENWVYVTSQQEG